MPPMPTRLKKYTYLDRTTFGWYDVLPFFLIIYLKFWFGNGGLELRRKCFTSAAHLLAGNT